MLKPIHTHLTSYYIVKRPLLWFCEDDKVTREQIEEYFTLKAIQSLLKYEFLIIHRP